MFIESKNLLVHPAKSSSTLSRLLIAVSLALLLAASFLIAPDSPVIGGGVLAQSNPTPPCEDSYGSSSDRAAIETAMYSGTRLDVVNAINNAKATRGSRVGCYDTCLTYTTPDFTEPTLAAIEEKWNTVHAPGLADYALGCPAVGRTWASVAFGGYYAQLAGYATDLNKLADIADMYEAQQYKASNAPSPAVTYAGIFGYLHTTSTDPCYPLPVGSGIDPCTGNTLPPSPAPIDQFCNANPSICVTYTGGLFAGRNFLVADLIPEQDIYDGGIAYDHGWVGVMMVEAGIQQVSQEHKIRFKDSALLAGEWAIAEPPVRNHNYTAKLVWLLAELYGWSGSPQYKTALLDKLHRNLAPGVLMDSNSDGFVDGMSNQPFSGLTPVAQRPGRMWDGHNARPTYHPMNAWALVEAYVALRDRGNTAEAGELKPYAVAMLDNMAWEINNLGVPSTGSTQIPHALLLGLWKIAAYENEPHPEWAQASWAMWNYGLANSFGANTVNVGLYLLYKSGIPYIPLHKRSGVYQPIAYQVASGQKLGGTLSSLFDDDDNYLPLGNSSAPSIVSHFEITQQELTKLRLLVISADSTNATRQLYIWNNSVSAWNQVAANSVSTSESVISITLTSNLTSYINNGIITFAVEHGGVPSAHTMYVEKVQLGINE